MSPVTEVEGALSPLARALARTEFAQRWYRWCDTTRDWSAEAEHSYDVDSLRTDHGGFAPLDIKEFLQAYAAAGAEVSRGSTFPGPRHRSFTVDVHHDGVLVSTAIRLGRGINTQECSTLVRVDGREESAPQMLHVLALEIRRHRGDPDPDPLYPRPLITSRSHLEVSTRELVATLRAVATDWSNTRD